MLGLCFIRGIPSNYYCTFESNYNVRMSFVRNLIYQKHFNYILRNVCKAFGGLIPENKKLHPSGKLRLKVDGLRFVLNTNQTSYVTRQLFWIGPANYEYSTIFIDLIKDCTVFFDVGASLGYYTILATKANPEVRVFSFEPSVGAMNYLSENVSINDVADRVMLESIALSDTNGQVQFNEVKNPKFPNIDNLSGEHNLKTKKGLDTNAVTVEARTLNDYVADSKIVNIDLIKLDTEGAEHLILKGGSKVIDRFRPIIICEVLFNSIEKQLEQIMLSHNYAFYNHTASGLKKVSTIQRTEDDGVRNCFFVPREKENTVAPFLN